MSLCPETRRRAVAHQTQARSRFSVHDSTVRLLAPGHWGSKTQKGRESFPQPLHTTQKLLQERQTRIMLSQVSESTQQFVACYSPEELLGRVLKRCGSPALINLVYKILAVNRALSSPSVPHQFRLTRYFHVFRSVMFSKCLARDCRDPFLA